MPRFNVSRFILALTFVLPASVFSAEGDGATARPDASAARKILEHYVGHWKGHGRRSETDGLQKRSNNETGGRFILGEKFVEMRSIDSEGRSNLQIIGFDERSASYRLRAFSSTRDWLQASGKWDADTSTMIWRGTMYGELRFHAEEKHEMERMRAAWRISNKRGRATLLGSSDDRRVSRAAPGNLFEKALRTVPDSHIAELKPLHDYVGPWRETLEVQVPGRETIRGAGTYVASWVLGGAVQLWRGRRETSLGSEEYLWVFIFDEAEQEHRAWWLSAQGVVVEYVGGRKSGSSVWRWHANGLGADVQQSLTMEQAASVRVESTLIIRGTSGKGITLRATAKRDRSPAN